MTVAQALCRVCAVLVLVAGCSPVAAADPLDRDDAPGDEHPDLY